MSISAVTIPAGLAAKVATSGIASAIKALYGIAGPLNDFIDDLIGKMQQSENPTIARTGRVIEGAKLGFGIGYIVPITIIALGQFILGNPLSAVVTLGSAAVASNPIAMTCAAVGAIYYGWAALSKSEQYEIVEKIRKDLEIGAELIKSIVNFILTKTKELLSAENFKEMKRFINEAADSFGKSLGEVTGAIKDRLADTYGTVKGSVRQAGSVVGTTARRALPRFKR